LDEVLKMPQDPIGTMINSAMQAVEPMAPHNVLPQLLSPLTAIFQGGSGQGIRERRQNQDIFSQQVAARRQAELRTGFGGTEPINPNTGIATTIF
jgi:hypothetical protein|tara:strand:+ start:5093 stop:5377 length:285 start_codon:yes stop_codon:yes gene_type:complete